MSHQQLVFHAPVTNNYQYNEYEIQLLQHSHNPYEVKHRKRTSRFQLSILEATFAENPKPSGVIKKQIALQTKMPIRAIQVWFQNRRAKAKNQALKAAAARAREARGDPPLKDEDQEDDDDEPNSPVLDGDRSSTPIPFNNDRPPPTAFENSKPQLSAPSNLALRRGSAPAPLGLGQGLPTFAFKIEPEPISARAPLHPPAPPAASEPVAGLGYLEPFPPPSTSPQLSDHLARRRSLPAFHPEHQTYIQPRRQSVLSHSQGSNLPPPSSTPSFHPYRSSLQQRRLASANHPPSGPSHPAQISPNHTGAGAHRSGSTPGHFSQNGEPYRTGPFRRPSVPWAQPQLPFDSTQEEPPVNPPYSFAPRQFSAVPGSGPLPRADFSFGVQEESADNGSALHSSPSPIGGEHDSESGLSPPFVNFTNPQATRFGSMASIASSVSVESDATGATGTTAASSSSSGLQGDGLAPPGLPWGFGLSRSRLAASSEAIGQSQFNMGGDSAGYNSNFTFGNNAGGPPSSGSGAIQFPVGFQPDMRRQSCPAQFVDMFSVLGVDRSQPNLASQQSFGSFASGGKGYPSLSQRPSFSSSFRKSPLGLIESPTLASAQAVTEFSLLPPSRAQPTIDEHSDEHPNTPGGGSRFANHGWKQDASTSTPLLTMPVNQMDQVGDVYGIRYENTPPSSNSPSTADASPALNNEVGTLGQNWSDGLNQLGAVSCDSSAFLPADFTSALYARPADQSGIYSQDALSDGQANASQGYLPQYPAANAYAAPGFSFGAAPIYDSGNSYQDYPYRGGNHDYSQPATGGFSDKTNGQLNFGHSEPHFTQTPLRPSASSSSLAAAMNCAPPVLANR